LEAWQKRGFSEERVAGGRVILKLKLNKLCGRLCTPLFGLRRDTNGGNV
jgi:hypothetical protein